MLVHLRWSDLNTQQREAVSTTDGPLLVIAGAGSGKTRVITYRIAHLLSQGIPPSRILAVTFTNKAAEEMRERVERLVGQRLASSLFLSTFHALGLYILNVEKESLGFPQGFTIYDTADQLGVVREILREAAIAERRIDPKAVLSRISRLKNAGISPDAFLQHVSSLSFVSEYDGFAAEIYPRYQEKMRGFHALDFDDLLVETLRLFNTVPKIAARWKQRFSHVMVDEYQDTNHCQLELLKHLCPPPHHIAVVGDDDQAIYGFRGAVTDNILSFQKDFPNATLITLEENYRSTQPILDAANAVISNNATRNKKQLRSQRQQGDLIQIVVCDDAEQEAKFVVEEIELLLAQKKVGLADIAILYRSNVQAKLFEEELRQARIEYRMIGGQAFFDRKEVKDALAYLKLLFYPRDEISLRRILNYPARGIGASSLSVLESCQQEYRKMQPPHQGAECSLLEAMRELPHTKFATKVPRATLTAMTQFTAMIDKYSSLMKQTDDIAGCATLFLQEAGIPDDLISSGPTAQAAKRRLAHLEGLMDSLRRMQQKSHDLQWISNYLQRLSLQTKDPDPDADLGNVITLSTLHGAKGLEFKVVFLVGMEEELIPHKRTLTPTETDQTDIGGTTDLSEERRLFYVGITRARDRLYLSRALVRNQRNTPRMPSRFLQELPDAVLQHREFGLQQTGLSPEEETSLILAQFEKLKALTEKS